MTLRFDGKVAIVTGAGNGLGKAYALLFGSRGASVVVNDLGVSRDGEGKDGRPADHVVNEIRAAGGVAVADYHSVEDGAAIVQTALDAFGHLDIVVNNAGILRDRSFVRMSDQDWDLVHAVHLKGSFQVTRAAFSHLKKQGYGRIIMTSSVAGIYGNFGQANYSSAKLGLHGLSQTLAHEGARYNIHCNTVAPMGGTRLTEDILPPDLFAGLKPELIAPLVMWLCHEDCQDNGGLFEAAAGWYGKYRFERSVGHVCRGSLNELVTPETVRDQWGNISSFEGALHPTSNEEAAGLLARVLEDLRDNEGSNNKHIDINNNNINAATSGPACAIGWSQPPVKFEYTSKDVVLYALGVGAGVGDLRYVYENHEDFCALPTFAIMAAQAALLESSIMAGGVVGWSPDITRLLHGEQYLELHAPLPSSGSLLSHLSVADVLDKGSGALIVLNINITTMDGSPVASTQWLLFAAGDGKFGGKRNSDVIVPMAELPQRAPDAVLEHTTSADQAALYRLSGDLNPLHIDPSFAAMGGFDKPILHGLCSLGVAVRAVLATYCNGDPSAVKAVKVRFVKPVLPGHTLVTEMWQQEGNRILFKVTNRDTSNVCLTGGFVELTTSPSSPKSLPNTAPSTPIFEELRRRVEAKGKELVEKVQGLFLFNVMDNDNSSLPPAQWTVDLKTSLGSVTFGVPSNGVKPNVTMTLDNKTLGQLVAGTLNPQKAFMTGALKVAGNLLLSQKLREIFDTNQAKM